MIDSDDYANECKKNIIHSGRILQIIHINKQMHY